MGFIQFKGCLALRSHPHTITTHQISHKNRSLNKLLPLPSLPPYKVYWNREQEISGVLEFVCEPLFFSLKTADPIQCNDIRNVVQFLLLLTIMNGSNQIRKLCVMLAPTEFSIPLCKQSEHPWKQLIGSLLLMSFFRQGCRCATPMARVCLSAGTTSFGSE